MVPVFITGGTGYMGRRLIKKLVALGYDVTALVRSGSENKLPKGVRAIIANPFDASSFQQWIKKDSVFIQLLGATPSPRSKQSQLREVDLLSAKASVDAALAAGASQFVYVSIAMTELSVLKEFQQVRKEGEAYAFAKGLPCTFVRPWYIVGPGRWWPALFFPVYALARLRPQWQKKLKALSLVYLGQTLRILQKIVESPAMPKRIVEVQHIKRGVLPAI